MVCFSLTTARLSNWPLTVGSAPKPSIRRLLIVEQWSDDPWRLAPRTISWSFLLISLEIIYTKIKYLVGKWKSWEIGVPRRNDLDVFGFGWLIKFKGLNDLCSFESKWVQINANFQRRERGRNLGAFRVYFQSVGLGGLGRCTEFSTAWFGEVCNQMYLS